MKAEHERRIYTEDAAVEGEGQLSNSVGLLFPIPQALRGSLQHSLSLKY